MNEQKKYCPLCFNELKDCQCSPMDLAKIHKAKISLSCPWCGANKIIEFTSTGKENDVSIVLDKCFYCGNLFVYYSGKDAHTEKYIRNFI
jgi:hypothetical protein